jgi:hypothetical protein
MIATVDQEAIALYAGACPHCGKIVVSFEMGRWEANIFHKLSDARLLVPLVGTRPPVPPEVPADIAADYTEAALVLSLSPKASAALSRRCLQAVLRAAGYTQKDLAPQIAAALPNLPTYLAENVDAIRATGNFGAHPVKSTASGEIVDVEPSEAEWNLDVLDELFDFYYVQPAVAKKKREALNAKLAAAGKPPMK